MSRGRPFGSIRQLRSGLLQVRYVGSDGLRHAAPSTFRTKTEARRWLSMVEADLARGTWEPDEVDGEPLSAYGSRWISERSGLSERSVVLYESLLRLHIAPKLGATGIRKITPAMVRSWRQGLLDAGTGPSTVAKAYRLLRSIMNTAEDDELIRRNPCRIKGAGEERPAERPVLAVSEVMRLADRIEPRYRVLVLLAVFGSLRWGELMGLIKTDFDLAHGLVHVERSVVLIRGHQVVKPPKTAAGTRTVALPRWLLPELERHFELFSELSPTGRVFVGPYGVSPARSNFSKVWARAVAGGGFPAGLRFHDLRHAGNHLAAMTGASTRELMGRMGHVSVNAALVYQHRTASRDRAIADALDGMLTGYPTGDGGQDGQRAGHVGGTPPG